MNNINAEKREHVFYFDYLRLIAAFCVVYMHVAASPLRNGISLGWYFNDVLVSFSFCAVPLFFMMSGYLILTSEKTADVTFLLKKRIPHLLVPLIFWSLFYAVYDNLISGGVNVKAILDLLKNCLFVPTEVHLWYIYTLIALYIISPLLFGGVKLLEKKGRVYVFIILSSFTLISCINTVLSAFSIHTFDVDLFSKLEIFGGDLLIFLIGYFLGSTKIKIPNFVLIISSVLTLGIISAGTYFTTKAFGEYNQLFQNQHHGFEVLLAAELFLLFKQKFDKPLKIMKAIPIVPLSMPIYFSHLFFIYFSYRHGIINSGFKGTVIMSVAVFVISFLFSKTVASVKPICFAVTGMKYKDACKTCNWIFTFNRIKNRVKQKNN